MNTLDRLRALAGQPFTSFRATDLLTLRAAIVYVWLRNEEVLYVGMSTTGLARPFDIHHERMQGITEDDLLLIWACSSERHARTVERLLIHEIRPTRNICRTRPASVEGLRSSKSPFGNGIFRRGKAWYVEFQRGGRRYRKSLGRGIPLTLARGLALKFRASLTS